MALKANMSSLDWNEWYLLMGVGLFPQVADYILNTEFTNWRSAIYGLFLLLYTGCSISLAYLRDSRKTV